MCLSLSACALCVRLEEPRGLQVTLWTLFYWVCLEWNVNRNLFRDCCHISHAHRDPALLATVTQLTLRVFFPYKDVYLGYTG